jgi:hypothetical protein
MSGFNLRLGDAAETKPTDEHYVGVTTYPFGAVQYLSGGGYASRDRVGYAQGDRDGYASCGYVDGSKFVSAQNLLHCPIIPAPVGPCARLETIAGPIAGTWEPLLARPNRLWPNALAKPGPLMHYLGPRRTLSVRRCRF